MPERGPIQWIQETFESALGRKEKDPGPLDPFDSCFGGPGNEIDRYLAGAVEEPLIEKPRVEVKDQSERVYFADETLVHPDWSRAGPTHPWHLDEGEKLYAQRLPGRRVARRRLPSLAAWRALGGALISQDGTENNHFLLAPDRVFGARVEDAHAIKPKTERKRK